MKYIACTQTPRHIAKPLWHSPNDGVQQEVPGQSGEPVCGRVDPRHDLDLLGAAQSLADRADQEAAQEDEPADGKLEHKEEIVLIIFFL